MKTDKITIAAAVLLSLTSGLSVWGGYEFLTDAKKAHTKAGASACVKCEMIGGGVTSLGGACVKTKLDSDGKRVADGTPKRNMGCTGVSYRGTSGGSAERTELSYNQQCFGSKIGLGLSGPCDWVQECTEIGTCSNS